MCSSDLLQKMEQQWLLKLLVSCPSLHPPEQLHQTCGWDQIPGLHPAALKPASWLGLMAVGSGLGHCLRPGLFPADMIHLPRLVQDALLTLLCLGLQQDALKIAPVDVKLKTLQGDQMAS